jgi:caffeoyl-CoA O-methyltransferase
MKEPTFLKTMVQKAQARRVLEIGTFDGTSALAMAEMLPDDGTVITCEINPGLASLARKRFSRSPHGRKIEVLVGPALETLRSLTGPFDLIFIDADTENYVRYYHRALELLAPTGMLLLDNMRGITLGPVDHSRDPAVGVIIELGRVIADDTRVVASFKAVRDGVLVITMAPDVP